MHFYNSDNEILCQITGPTENEFSWLCFRAALKVAIFFAFLPALLLGAVALRPAVELGYLVNFLFLSALTFGAFATVVVLLPTKSKPTEEQTQD